MGSPRPVTPPQPQPPTNPISQGLNESELFDHPEPEVEDQRTRIIPGGSIKALPRISDQPTDPRRSAIPREQPSSGSSKGVLVLAAIVALLLGAVGGAFIFRSMQAPPPAQASVVHFSLSSDRPATVWLGKQELGATPLSVFVPSGRHLLELREEEGARRSFEVNLPAGESEAKMVVTLDSLPQLP
jgi:hypothetical protein